MRWPDLLATSLASLRQRAFRTSLTMLGVVIGTTAVIVMVSLGIGMSSSFDSSVDTSTLRQVTVYQPPQAAATNGLPETMNDAMVTHLATFPGVEAAWPSYSVDVTLRVGAFESPMEITGLPHEALVALDLPLAWGRLPDPGDPLAVVVGSQVSMMFWDERTEQPADIDFTRETLFVIFDDGMTDPAGPQPVESPGPGEGQDDTPTPVEAPKRVIVPVAAVLSDEEGWTPQSMTMYADLAALIRLLEKAMPGQALPKQPASAGGTPLKGFVYDSVVLVAEDPEAAEALMLDLRDQGYEVTAEIEWIRQAQQQGVLIQAVFGGIGFISLLVAAIGIANTMLMNIYERTREIGIMKVLGSSLGDIRKLFLIESATIGFFGGLAGLVVSLIISWLLNATLGASMMGDVGGTLSLIPFWLAFGAGAFSTLIGTLAGLAPAQRAAALSPLAAIRNQ